MIVSRKKKVRTMSNTQQASKSFIWAENPTISSRCSQCGAFVKHSIDDNDQPLFLSVPYRISTIKIFDGGRTFEKVDRSYLHVCQSSMAAEPNSNRDIREGNGFFIDRWFCNDCLGDDDAKRRQAVDD